MLRWNSNLVGLISLPELAVGGMGEQPSLTGLGESAEPKRFIPVSEAFLLPALEEFLNRDVMASDQDEAFMRRAIRVMRDAGVVYKTGGPFGAVIVKNGQVIAAAGNSVIQDKDPSAHAEVNAIRQACRTLDNWDLSGCVMYSSCECCPMCYSTAYWANIRQVFYAASWSDYEDLFSDRAINDDIRRPVPEKEIRMQQILQSEAQAVWAEFRQLPDGARY